MKLPPNFGKFVVALLLFVSVIVFREPLLDWFLNADEPADSTHAHVALAPEAVEAIRSAQGPYERVRDALAADSLEGLAAAGSEIQKALEKASAAAPMMSAQLKEGAAAAGHLGHAKTLEEARKQFGLMSQAIIGAASHAPELLAGLHLFECPMTGGYGKWLQKSEKIENPYMGPKMLACGGPAAVDAPRTEGEIAHYTCPMHPSVKQPDKGTCPICGMDLVPITKEALESGELALDPGQLHRSGIHSSPVELAPMPLTLQTLGRITYDETKITDVTLKVGGYIRDLRVDEPGQKVRKGETLFSLYSPELLATQTEYVVALESGSKGLIDAARERLLLWGISSQQLDRIAQTRKTVEALPIAAPASGYVVEKNVVDGAAVEAGMRLYRIARLDTVWVEAQLYEADLPHVKVGQPARITLPYAPGRAYSGKVVLLAPSLDGATRTATARIALDNADGVLRPEMFADVSLAVDRGERLQIPVSAVVYTGPRRLVFVDLGEGRLVPREVILGMRSGDRYEVIEGLKKGERVVTSGNFLVASESRLRSMTGELPGGHQHGEGDGGAK